MAEPKLNIAVAGLGRVGWSFHCRRLAAHADFALTAVADTEPDRRAEAERELGCTSYADFYDLLEREQLDAVVIATPTHLHRDMAIAALDRGLHVLLEKPMAMSLHEGTEIAQVAQAQSRVLTVYQPHRHNAYFQQVKHLVESGKIGRVTGVLRGSFSYARRNDWQSLQEYGGGMLNNYGAHFIDQVLQLIGYDIKRVFCDLQLVASLGDADDVATVVIETEQGSIGQVTINQASVVKPYDLVVWGTCGAVVFDGKQVRLRCFDPAQLPEKELQRSLSSADRKYPSDAIEYEDESVPVDSSFQFDVFADFARAVRTGGDPAVKPCETLAVMKVLEQCRANSDGIERLS